jgi:hypothetical protein
MSTTEPPRRLALVLAGHHAGPGAPPGVDPAEFAQSCLADTYEVLADLVGIGSGIVGPPESAELLWPGGVLLPDQPIREIAAQVAADYDELVLVPADLPDLPGLVLAKMYKVLHRVDVTISPERGGPGCAAIGLSLPLAGWIPDLDLDLDPFDRLLSLAPSPVGGRSRCVRSPDWHRLRTPDAVHRLDPGLEGWEQTRALLSGHRLGRA